MSTGQQNPAKSTAGFIPTHGMRKGTTYNCTKCDVGLHMVPCFTEYYINVNL
jgi:hypothetical protein